MICSRTSRYGSRRAFRILQWSKRSPAGWGPLRAFQTRNTHPILLLIAVAGAIVLFFFIVHAQRRRVVKRSIDVAAMLPQSRDATLFFANVKALRDAGYLQLLTGKVPADVSYQEFVAGTGFDYTRDLDAIAATIGPQNRIQSVVQGRFDWYRFESYAENHRGQCRDQTCTMPASQPGRWISFSEIEPGVIGLLITSAEHSTSARMFEISRRVRANLPSSPVWVRPAASILQSPSSLPFALRIFAITLQSASSVTLSLDRASPPAVFNLNLDAWFENPAVADTARTQLQMNTTLLKIELGKRHGSPDPADLTGLLTAGTFTTSGKELHATWPVEKELMEALR